MGAIVLEIYKIMFSMGIVSIIEVLKLDDLPKDLSARRLVKLRYAWR